MEAAMNSATILWELTKAADSAQLQRRLVPKTPRLENFFLTENMERFAILNTVQENLTLSLAEVQLYRPQLVNLSFIRFVMGKIAANLLYFHSFEPDRFCASLSLSIESVSVLFDANDQPIDVVFSEFVNSKLCPNIPLGPDYVLDLLDILKKIFPTSTEFQYYLPPEFFDPTYIGDIRHYDIRSIDMWMAGMVLLRLLATLHNPFDPPQPHYLTSNLIEVLKQPNADQIMMYHYGHVLPGQEGAECIDLMVRLLRIHAPHRMNARLFLDHPFVAPYLQPYFQHTIVHGAATTALPVAMHA
jgi:hypothetical protein